MHSDWIARHGIQYDRGTMHRSSRTVWSALNCDWFIQVFAFSCRKGSEPVQPPEGNTTLHSITLRMHYCPYLCVMVEIAANPASQTLFPRFRQPSCQEKKMSGSCERKMFGTWAFCLILCTSISPGIKNNRIATTSNWCLIGNVQYCFHSCEAAPQKAVWSVIISTTWSTSWKKKENKGDYTSLVELERKVKVKAKAEILTHQRFSWPSGHWKTSSTFRQEHQSRRTHIVLFTRDDWSRFFNNSSKAKNTQQIMDGWVLYMYHVHGLWSVFSR